MANARAGWAIFKIRLAEGVQYRVAGISGAAVGIVWVFIDISLYTVFFKYGAGEAIINGMGLAQVIAYQWVREIIFMIQAFNYDQEIHDKIVSGDVGLELCRPLPVYTHWFYKNLGGRVAPLVWRGSFTLLGGIALVPFGIGITPPGSWAGFLCFLLSFLSAILLCAAFATLICVVRLNVAWGDGPGWMVMFIASVFSGNYVPLQLWPDALQRFLFIQPFAGVTDLPVRFYIGTASPAQIFSVLGVQCAWMLIFTLAGKLLLRKRLKTIEVQGG